MPVLFWNINGFACDESRCKLQELLKEFKPDIFCLAEPKVHCTLTFLRGLYVDGYKKEVIHNLVGRSKGNLWIFWSMDIATPVMVNSSRQAITIKAEDVFISFVHASCFQVTRRSLRQQLSSFDNNIPWLVMGDFNCVFRNDEKKGGCTPSTSAINEFSDWLGDNNLFEADSLGSKYTWANGLSGVHRILCKLDRVVIDEAWLMKFENWRYFMSMVMESWNAPVSGSPDYIYPYKLKRLKAAMKEWNFRFFGNVNARLKQAKLTMEVALRISDEDPEDITKLNFAKEASVTLQKIRMRQSIMLKQKSRNKWLKEGASNTSFFHATIHTRRSSDMISELVDDDGNVISNCDQIRDYTVSYFESKFNGVELPIDEQLFHYEHDTISTEESHRMDAIPTYDEIKADVYDLDDDSAPGPDGFSGCFYIHCWDVIQQDLYNAVTYCWEHQRIPNGVNSSLLILLAKVRGANTLRNFRPIGLSNFFFKFFTKILSTRLGSVLDKLVSEEQVAFMKGRNIHENISVASELVNDLKTKHKGGNVGLKLDITQAFDIVSWSFVLEVFRRYGFSQQWCSWIYSVLRSSRISILLNGSPDGFFKINRGNLRSLHNLLELLGKYQTASIQTVCHQKSKVYYGGGTLSRCRTITDLLGMEVSTFPDRYLGVQIMPGAVKYRHISNVVDKIKKQLSVWKGKMLSFQDRFILINSVISSYAIHNMVVYKWPQKFIQ
ncbi:uncharacterized protein LOC113343830 [Papaver somniferum]|uniref:uncharacterized protein LOC113343830 n=1 Tax=Papaver somniferum TaxID=3469 RepID=UPI000E701C7E|nr:uncharacterized protein LOC113343830 [Papaver somniferum]